MRIQNYGVFTVTLVMLLIGEETRGKMLSCVRDDVMIIAETIKNVTTSPVLNDALLECYGTCQKFHNCEHWSLDISKRKCELKNKNFPLISSPHVFSGDRLCSQSCLKAVDELQCEGRDCEASGTFTSVCGTNFSLDLLIGQNGNANFNISVRVNDQFYGFCARESKMPSPWYSCGDFAVPKNESFSVKLRSMSMLTRERRFDLDPNSTMHSILYRISYQQKVFYSFEPASSCSMVENLNAVRECTVVGCGEYCFSDDTFYDLQPRSSCFLRGREYGIFRRVCRGRDKCKILSGWTDWSPCSNTCGYGYRTRSREHEGTECPSRSILEHTSCFRSSGCSSQSRGSETSSDACEEG